MLCSSQPVWQASEGEGKGKDKCTKRGRIECGRITVWDSHPFSLPPSLWLPSPSTACHLGCVHLTIVNIVRTDKNFNFLKAIKLSTFWMLIEEQLFKSAIGHFRDALCLSVKTNICARPLLLKCVLSYKFIFIQAKLILIRKVSQDDLFWNRGKWWLRRGLLWWVCSSEYYQIKRSSKTRQ